MKEYTFMVALGEHGLPVPYAVAHNRHCVLMTMVDAVPLVQVSIACSIVTMVDAVPLVQVSIDFRIVPVGLTAACICRSPCVFGNNVNNQ